MTHTYFPYYDYKETGNSTLTLPYNINPAFAASLDPRDIISEWSEESKRTLTEADIYEGMKIYSLDDRNLRICRWIPKVLSTCYFNANDCIWDKLHGDENEWIDISTYSPEQSIDKQIEKAEQTKWQYNILPNNTYFGFNKFNLINNDELNYIINNVENNNIIAKTYTLTETKIAKGESTLEFNIDFTNYDDKAAKEFADTSMQFIMICPSKYRDKSTQKRHIQSIDLNGSIFDLTYESKELYSKYEADNCLFDIYTSIQLIDKDMIIKLINGESTIKVIFDKNYTD